MLYKDCIKATDKFFTITFVVGDLSPNRELIPNVVQGLH